MAVTMTDAGPDGHGISGVVLANDDLGEAAERYLQYLCARGGMKCNKSDRDRSGWDFIVDLDAPDGILDQRRKTTCHVQLKSTARLGASSVPLRLSSADLLAKDPHPALVVVFKMRPDGTVVRGFVVHLLDEPLARLLRRLRNEEARGRRNINNQRISFDFRRHGKAFEPTPAGLRAALQEACGPDPSAYATEKLRQLEELGYGEDGIVARATFRPESEAHFTRVVLGLEPLRQFHIAAFDNRFGIPVPYRGDMFDLIEEVTLAPPSAGGCEVAVTGPPLTPAATFHAEIFYAPPFDQRLRMLIRHPDFTLMFRETDAAFETTGAFDGRARPLDELAMLLRALSNMASGQSEMVINGDDGRFGPIRLPLIDVLTGPYVAELSILQRIASDWQRLLALAGVRPKAAVGIEDLWNSTGVQLAADLLLTDPTTARFAFDVEELDGDGGPLTAVYFNNAEMAGDGIAYAVELVLEPSERDPRVYRSVAVRPIEVRRKVDDLDGYMEKLAGRYERPIMIHPDNVRRVDDASLEVAGAGGGGDVLGIDGDGANDQG